MRHRKLARGVLTIAVVAGSGLGLGPQADAALPHCNSSMMRAITGVYPTKYALQPVRNGSTSCILSYGDSGEGVKAMQVALSVCADSSIDVDGTFGPSTRSYLRLYQRNTHLGVDGIYGPQTRLRLGYAGDCGDTLI